MLDGDSQAQQASKFRGSRKFKKLKLYYVREACDPKNMMHVAFDGPENSGVRLL
jgi:hypothetical protein